jgi:hypothetical protein
VEPRFDRETADLVRSWGRHDREVLRDYLVRDLFERLSIDAMARAVAEVGRVTGSSVLAHFFQMHNEHAWTLHLERRL